MVGQQGNRVELSPDDDISILCWPDEQARLESLRRARRPRLVFCGDGATLEPSDELEVWVSASSDLAELRARLATLRLNTAQRSPHPVLDGSGVLWVRDRWVALSPIQSELTRILLENFGGVVANKVLHEAWADPQPEYGAFAVGLARLRRRVKPLGLELHSIHGRGYLLVFG